MGQRLSVYASVCIGKNHEDQFDVAFSVLGDDIRIIIWEDEDTKMQAQMNLTDKEAIHLINVLRVAVEAGRR